MLTDINKESCCGCAACDDVCPAEAIQMRPDREGFRYPQIQPSACVHCGRCEAVCPLRQDAAPPTESFFFGAQAKAETDRFDSSSGGVFPVLAGYVFRRRGAVFATAFNEEMEAVFQEAWNREELEPLRRTKYVQSRPDGVYRRIQTLLDQGAWVLFCGTPCQAHALKRFLGSPRERLILADLICYGVPSPGLWRSYTRFLERRHGGGMTAFSFRDKRNKDNGHTRSYVIGGREYADPLGQDLYCKLFFNNLSIRPSCHACRYCTPDRESDITLGDFWGVEKVRPQADDGMGTSLVILHTAKARDIWEEAKEVLDWFPCERTEALQPRLLEPTAPSPRRGLFMTLYRALPSSSLFFLLEKVRAVRGLLQRLRLR